MQAQPEMMERMSKAELEERLQRGEEVIIVDARSTNAFESSNIRPKGSVRIAPGTMNGEIARLPKDRTIVTV